MEDCINGYYVQLYYEECYIWRDHISNKLIFPYNINNQTTFFMFCWTTNKRISPVWSHGPVLAGMFTECEDPWHYQEQHRPRSIRDPKTHKWQNNSGPSWCQCFGHSVHGATDDNENEFSHPNGFWNHRWVTLKGISFVHYKSSLIIPFCSLNKINRS